MKTFIFVCLLIVVQVFAQPKQNDTIEKGACECAVFDTNELKGDETPILKQRPMNVTCDEDGQATCHIMCTGLAQAAKEDGPSVLCAEFAHMDNLVPSLFVKSCEAAEWTYTNLTRPEPICCHEKLPVECKNDKQ